MNKKEYEKYLEDIQKEGIFKTILNFIAPLLILLWFCIIIGLIGWFIINF